MPINSPQDIKDPLTQTRLVSFQSVTNDVNEQYKAVEDGIHRKHGMIDAAKVLGDRIFQECEKINRLVDAQGLPVDEAKIRVDQTQKIVNIIRDIESLNKTDLVLLRGKLDGFKIVFDTLEKRFTGEIAKYERHLRMEEDQAPVREMRAEKINQRQKKNEKPAPKRRGRPPKKKV